MTAIIRPTRQLHTIDQWLATDPTIRAEVLRNIKLKDRLYRWLVEHEKKDKKLTEATWKKCGECDGVGHYLKEPRYDGIHPSQLPHPCMLKIFNDMIGVKGEMRHEARLLLIFALGTAAHKMFQGYGDKGAWGPHYRKEAAIQADLQELAETLMIEGHADADNILTIEEIPGVIIEIGLVHEYKTINSNGFEKLTRPKPEHKTQAMVYSAALNRPVVVYMYLNKNDSNIADFPVPFEPELWQTINQKCETLLGYYSHHEAVTSQGGTPTLPPAEVGFHCKDCEHSSTCPPYREHLTQLKKR